MKNSEKTKYVCQECGYESIKFLGRCPECGKWSTLVEEKSFVPASSPKRLTNFSSEVRKIGDIADKNFSRYQTGIAEIDNLLGGGIVDGQMILIGGEPGVGKSTLFLQIAGRLSAGHRCLYVSGEESLEQLKMRAGRLGVVSENLFVVSETLLGEIAVKIGEVKPKFLFIDSIQTMYRDDIPSAPGSVSQVRETAAEILNISKSSGIATFVCGHVTKEGTLAGPRVLEHLVDTVLYFESTRHHSYRILRCFKNRFGSVNEIGIFEMEQDGLRVVDNPSEIFIAEKPANISGSVITCVIEGARPILLEVQALVSPTPLPVPRRQFSGIDFSRATIIIAVLEKRLGLRIGTQDVFINVVGGIKTSEPSCDLAVACAISSAVHNFAVSSKTGIIGEVGLTGEVRAVANIAKRLSEFEKMGFEKCIVPRANLRTIKEGRIKICAVDTVLDAIEALKNKNI